MKRRAGQVGERLGRELLGPAFTALGERAPRLHLIGHSFGAKLLTSAVLGGLRPETLVLLLAAFSAFAFAEAVPGTKRPGFYRRVITERMVGDRLVALRSAHDRALTTLYPAVTWGSQVDRAAPNPGRLGRVREVVARSALGAVGALGLGAPVDRSGRGADHRDPPRHGHGRRLACRRASRVAHRRPPRHLPRRDRDAGAAGRRAAHRRRRRSAPAPDLSPSCPVTRRMPMLDPLTPERPVAPRTRPKTTHVSQSEADWLVLAYLAADNDLEGELLTDLAEMERVGSRPGVVDVLAQIDRSAGQDTSKGNWHGTRRYYVTRGSDPRRIHSRLLADLGAHEHGRPRRAGELHPLRRAPLSRALDGARLAQPRLGLLRPAGDAVARRARARSRRRARQRAASPPPADLPHDARSGCSSPRRSAAASPTMTAPATAWTIRS